MSIYNTNKNNNKCYNSISKKWEKCEEIQSQKNESTRSSPSVPPTCCIDASLGCCINCADLFAIINCLSSALIDEAIPQTDYETIDIDTLQTQLNDISAVCGWSLTGGPSGVNPFGLRDLTTGQKLCITNITLSNSTYTLSVPGDSIVQCLNIRNDCGGGGGVSVGICYEVSIIDEGELDQWTVQYTNFRICTNPSIDEMINCIYCYA